MKILKPLPKVIVENIDNNCIVRYGNHIIGTMLSDADFWPPSKSNDCHAFKDSMEALLKYEKELSHVVTIKFRFMESLMSDIHLTQGEIIGISFALNPSYVVYK